MTQTDRSIDERVYAAVRDALAVVAQNPNAGPDVSSRFVASAVLAEVHRLPAGVAPAADRATLRQRIAEAIFTSDCPNGRWEMRPEDEHEHYLSSADAVLAAFEAAPTSKTITKADSKDEPPADRAALRQRIAAALVRYDWNAGLSGRVTPSEHHYGEADAVLAVLPAPVDQAVAARVRALHVPDETGECQHCHHSYDPCPTIRTLDEAPLSQYYSHEACGFHWHGRDGMDIPMQDGQPVCPRCELAKVQKQLAYTQRLRDEVGEECKRRGKIKLEQAEKIRALEGEIDGVRRQLGAEILRADQAEAELRRMADEAQPAAGEALERGRAQLIEAMSGVSEERWCAGWMESLDQRLHAEGGIWETIGRAVGWPTGNYDQWVWMSWDKAGHLYTSKEA
ncbi:hypothetical protein ACIQCF_07450 [Streptomyces sp. NPDC088353]|uniref:hypothetical protein n=1 Tax=Streptomyces sp. NPDC088353 TaxID=3365855 RepID=UPI003808FD62